MSDNNNQKKKPRKKKQRAIYSILAHKWGIFLFLVSVAFYCGTLYWQEQQKDTDGPKIHMDSDTVTISLEACIPEKERFADPELVKQAMLQGVTAEDKKDGDLTGSLIIEELSDFVADSTRKMTVVCVDSDNNVTKATRTVIYSDYRPPWYGITEPLRFPENTTNFTSTIYARDLIDGELGKNIRTVAKNQIVADEPGDYPVEFTVTNSAGDTTHLPVTVTIYSLAEESRSPRIELKKYLKYTKRGNKLDPTEFVKGCTYLGREYEWDSEEKEFVEVLKVKKDAAGKEIEPDRITKVKIDDTVDYDTPGNYEIVFKASVTKDGDTYTGSVRLVVVVS